MRLKSIWTAAGMAFLIGTSLPAHAQGIQTQHTFTGTPDGASPLALVWTNSLLYGSTANGGTQGDGSLFTFNPANGTFTTFFSFTNNIGFSSSPNNVVMTPSTIYGTTRFGTNTYGMIYSVGTDGTGFSPMHSFGTFPDGGGPECTLVLSGTTLYGTTYTGGTNGGGTVFKINTGGGGYALLHSFTNSPDGLSPQGGLVLGGSRLYGTTSGGGTNGDGTIYAINTDGTGYTQFYSFTNQPDGLYPYGEMVLANGVLYGTCSSGGTNNTGTIFTINTNGSGYRTLYSLGSFTGNADGSAPKATLTLSGSYLYGTAGGNGIDHGGTTFLINTNGTGFTVLANFTTNSDAGWNPAASPIRVGNSIWGTTYQGGANTYGTLYQLPMPAITMEPQSVTVTNSSPATFTMNAADDTTFTYKWYFNTNTLLAGQTTNSLTFASATNNNAGTYTVVVSDSFGSVTSSPAVLTVIVPGIPPSITTQPQNETVLANSPASFTNAASGTTPLYYRWYFNTNTLVSSGVNDTNFTISSATPAQAGYYSVIVTNLYGSATSTPALLTVNVGTKPAITQQPQNYTVTNGFTATFTNLASGTAPLFFEWYFNTTTLVSSGVNDTILTVSPATTNQAGYYTVVVTNLYGSATGGPAQLTVIVPAVKPSFTQQPQNISVTNGYDAAFTNAVSGTAPISYQWYFNTNTAIAGGTNAVLTVAFVATNNVGYYTVVATNAGGSVTSSPAKLTIISTKPIIFTPPAPTSVGLGNPFTFTVVAAGQSPLKYQWYTNRVIGGATQVGQTNSSATYPAATAQMQAYYLVVVTNQLGKATSSAAFLTVVTTPVMTLQPLSVSVTNGDPVNFTSAAVGAGVLHYQWYFSTNTLVTGATNTWLSFSNAVSTLAGTYDVRVANSYGAVTSSYAMLTVLAGSNQFQLLSFNVNPANGNASFAFAISADTTNLLYAATNLAPPVIWSLVGSNTTATNGFWYFTETNSTRTNRDRFFRFSSP
jgi:uncharacterized repeat protein (TIGR03803 family)